MRSIKNKNMKNKEFIQETKERLETSKYMAKWHMKKYREYVKQIAEDGKQLNKIKANETRH